MLTISFLSSSDMDELSISSKGGARKVRRSSFHQGGNCVTPIQDGTCVILFFISDAEHRLHPAVGFTHAVAAAHVSADRKQKDAKY